MIIRSIRQIVSGRPVPGVEPDATVRAACHLLDRLDVTALLVIEDGRLLGVVSESDVIRRCVCDARRTGETPVSAIMTADPVTIDLGAALADALTIMLDHGFRHLPVVEDGVALGLLSIRDIPAEYRLMRERFADHRAPDPRANGAAPHA